MITVEIPSVSSGHEELYFQDTTPEEREILAKKIMALLRDGHAIFLVQGEDAQLVKGYDPKTNEFLIQSSRLPIPENAKTLSKKGRKVKFKHQRISAAGQNLTAVAPSQGG